jgi:AcrR family transcriptional regulator
MTEPKAKPPRARAAKKSAAPLEQAGNRRSLLRQERSRQTRERLVRAALDLWGEQGYEETTVDEIAAAAGVSWSTFYFHFKNKGQLLSQLALMTAEVVAGELDKAAADEVSLFDGMHKLTAGIARRADRMPREVLAQVMKNSIVGIGEAGGAYDEGLPSFGKAIAGLFGQAVEEGELPDGLDIDELGAIGSAMIMEAMLRWSLGTASHGNLRMALDYRMELLVAGAKGRTS